MSMRTQKKLSVTGGLELRVHDWTSGAISKSTWVVLVFCIVLFCYWWFWSSSSFYLVIISPSFLEIGLKYIYCIRLSSWICCTNWCSSLISGASIHFTRAVYFTRFAWLHSFPGLWFCGDTSIGGIEHIEIVIFVYNYTYHRSLIYWWILLSRFGAFVASTGFYRIEIYKFEELFPDYPVSHCFAPLLHRFWSGPGLADCICHLLPLVDMSTDQSTVILFALLPGGPFAKNKVDNADDLQGTESVPANYSVLLLNVPTPNRSKWVTRWV